MKPIQISLVILALIAGILIICSFALLPYDQPGQAIDWKLFHQATHGFQIDYEGNRVYNPPWVLALLWPITVFPLEISRGIWALFTLVIFVLSVNQTNPKLWFASSLLLIFSYPMVRHLMDGNLEAITIGGVLLTLLTIRRKSLIYLAIGLILLSAKIQETWLFLFFLVFYLWINWPGREWTKSFAGVGVFVTPFLVWKGLEWFDSARSFPYSETINDSSLRYVLTKLELNEWTAWVIWGIVLFSTLWILLRSKPMMDLSIAAFLVTTGMMLSNYVAGDSLVTPLAIGVIPLFQRRAWVGLALILMYFLPYLAILNFELRLGWEHVYWTGVLLITWAALFYDIRANQRVSIHSILAITP